MRHNGTRAARTPPFPCRLDCGTIEWLAPRKAFLPLPALSGSGNIFAATIAHCPAVMICSALGQSIRLKAS
jgi:hypothetical protein